MSDETKNQLTAPGNNPLAGIDFGEHAGMGFDGQTSADMAIPFLTVLQANSPQVVDGSPTQIPGLKSGDLFNTVTQQKIEQPFCFVPCCTEHVYVEWVPRGKGGGFVAVHAVDSEIVAYAKNHIHTDETTGKKTMKSPEGNDVIETFYVYGLALDGPDGTESGAPMVIAFTSSKIKVYRRMNTALTTAVKGKVKPPMYAYRLAITTENAINKKNQPYKNYGIKPATGTSYLERMNLPGTEFEGLLAEGKSLVEAIRGGLARAAYQSQTTAETAEGSDVEEEAF